jgi:putative hydrolase of HD superfamily
MDKLEMVIQAYEYEKSDNKNLQSFFDSTKDVFYHPFSQAIAEAVYIERSGSGL